MSNYGPYESVLTENAWHDGPCAGIGHIGGVPHRFKAIFDEQADEYTAAFHVWPVAADELALEIEQWRLFVEWNTRYEAGLADTTTHPGQGSVNRRWDEIAACLDAARSQVPGHAQPAAMRLQRIERALRYDAGGPDYLISWQLLP